MLGEALGAIGGLIGSIFGSSKADKAAEENIKLQREFAQQGIRWKVEDAKAAGIHPLFALGAQTTAFQPVSVGGADWGTTGQNIGSAMGAMLTPKEKQDGFAKTVQNLTLEKMGLENEVLRSQLRLQLQPGRGPGMPVPRSIDGQGSTTMTTAGGVTVNVNPANTPAQDWENQYGEIGGELGGLGNLATDVWQTIDKAIKAQPKPKTVYDVLDYGGRGNVKTTFKPRYQ